MEIDQPAAEEEPEVAEEEEEAISEVRPMKEDSPEYVLQHED